MRQSLSLVLATFSAALILAAPGTRAQTSRAAPNADSAPAGNARNGQRIYTNYGCYECHGREGQGSSTTGPRIGPSPISFPAFIRYARQPTGQMPPYTSKVVSDSELADMYAFLQSLPQPDFSVGPGRTTNTVLGVIGNLGRNTLRGPALNDFDLSLFKNLAPGAERYKLQFRGEDFNVLNHSKFGERTTPVFDKNGNGLSTAGQLGPPTLTTSRQLQLGL